MEELSKLQEVLTNLKDCSDGIITSSLRLLNDILVEGGDIHKRFNADITAKGGQKRNGDEIDEIFGRAIKEYIKDATTVKSSLSQFARLLAKGDELDGDNFLSQVWAGDVYDNVKIDALCDLYDDICRQETDFTLEVIYKKAVDSASS